MQFEKQGWRKAQGSGLIWILSPKKWPRKLVSEFLKKRGMLSEERKEKMKKGIKMTLPIKKE